MSARAGMVGATLAALLGMVPGRALGQCCGDCDGNGMVTINELVTAVSRALASCRDDGVCDASVATCPGQLAACRGDLADCRAQSGCRVFPASGQRTAYGPGSDGDVRAGATLSYADNGDGTITDVNTGLMWEKKDDSGGIHDKDNTYTWGLTSEPYGMNGTMVTEFLARVNAAPCFAGHCDWRLPNVKELQSIADYDVPAPGPTASAAFHQAATCTGCAAVTTPDCSCTASDGYWSSTTYRNSPDLAWFVSFEGGGVGAFPKDGRFRVRAVRGGSGAASDARPSEQHGEF